STSRLARRCPQPELRPRAYASRGRRFGAGHDGRSTGRGSPKVSWITGSIRRVISVTIGWSWHAVSLSRVRLSSSCRWFVLIRTDDLSSLRARTMVLIAVDQADAVGWICLTVGIVVPRYARAAATNRADRRPARV
ncbi:MAG: hypothetical protein M3P18_02730, partial [Actinomycetota bacterium]|nr:hypothetical protein [Actinomycetota bacterium]